MLLKEIPRALLELLSEKRLILYAGAGLSAGSGLPSGSELAYTFAEELYNNRFYDTLPSRTAPPPLALVTQHYQVAFGRVKLNERLLNIFDKAELAPNDAHRAAVRLFQQIATTTFDRLLEDAVKHEGRNPLVVVRDIQLPYTATPDRTIIYKIHGDIGTPERIVITSRDYQKVPISPGLLNELRALLQSRNFLFIGYSLGDPDFLQQLENCRSIVGGELPKSYAVIPNCDKDVLFQKQCDIDNIELFSDTATHFLTEIENYFKEFVSSQQHKPVVPRAFTLDHADRDYRASICDEFRYIAFKGIPVLGGYLRVEIDKLFILTKLEPLPDIAAVQNSPEDEQRGRKAVPKLIKDSSLEKTAAEILKDNKKLFILGDPGSGKTTLLRYIAYCLCQPEPRYTELGLDAPYLPIYLPLREYAAFLRDSKAGTIKDFLPELLASHDLEKFLPVTTASLKQGRAVVLMDGLDEVATSEERAQVDRAVTIFANEYPTCRFILTSRKVGYVRAPENSQVAHFLVKPFTRSDVHQFLDLWCTATETQDSEKQNLLEALENPRVSPLAENPLLITILARVYKSYRNLPERRAQLYSKCVEALLTTWDLMRDLPPVFQDVREANRIMGPLALWIHRDMSGRLVTREQLLFQLDKGSLPRGQSSVTLLRQIEERSGLLRQVGLNQYAFSHLTFQEYYVARQLLSLEHPEKELKKFIKDSRWQEVTTLTAGLLDDLGSIPLTHFLDAFVIDPEFPRKPTALQTSKLNILIGCLKDKVEPEPRIPDYVESAVISYVENRDPRSEWILQKLPNLKGFSRCPVGAHICDSLRAKFTSVSSMAGANAIVVVYNMLREPKERFDVLYEVIKAADDKYILLHSIISAIPDLVNLMSDAEEKADALSRIRQLALERRQRFVGLLLPSCKTEDEKKKLKGTWLNEEEAAGLAAKASAAKL